MLMIGKVMGRKSWVWVGIPTNARSLEDCIVFENEPDWNKRREFIGGYIQQYPNKNHFVKGVKEMWVDEDGLLKRLPENRLANTLFSSKKADVMHKMGVINNARSFGLHDYIVIKINQKYEGSFPSFTGEPQKIVGNVIVALPTTDIIETVQPSAMDYDWEHIKRTSPPNFVKINTF